MTIVNNNAAARTPESLVLRFIVRSFWRAVRCRYFMTRRANKHPLSGSHERRVFRDAPWPLPTVCYIGSGPLGKATPPPVRRQGQGRPNLVAITFPREAWAY